MDSMHVTDFGLCLGQDSSVNASMLEMDTVEGEVGFVLGSANGNCTSTADCRLRVDAGAAADQLLHWPYPPG